MIQLLFDVFKLPFYSFLCEHESVKSDLVFCAFVTSALRYVLMNN